MRLRVCAFACVQERVEVEKATLTAAQESLAHRAQQKSAERDAFEHELHKHRQQLALLQTRSLQLASQRAALADQVLLIPSYFILPSLLHSSSHSLKVRCLALCFTSMLRFAQHFPLFPPHYPNARGDLSAFTHFHFHPLSLTLGLLTYLKNIALFYFIFREDPC